MPNTTTRTLLICSVPVVVALLSVYWFRKKKKFKTVSQAEYEKLDSLAECSLDSADTLSDASSFTSPENSEKSLRTKNFVNMTSNNIAVKDTDFCSSSPATPLLNRVEMNSFKMSPSSNKSESPLRNDCDFQTHNSLNIIKTADSDSDNNVADVGSAIYGNKRLDLAEKCNLLPSVLAGFGGIADIDADMQNVSNEVNDDESAEEMFSRLMKRPTYNSACMDPMEALEEILGFSPSSLRIVENGVSHSTSDSNENAASPPELEKLQLMETESNDSHSSVLDENSLSYTSDDSNKLPMNKSVLLGDFDESFMSSLCDQLGNFNSSMSSLKLHSVFNSEGGGDTITEEKVSDVDANQNPAQASVTKSEESPQNSSAEKAVLCIDDKCSSSMSPNDTVLPHTGSSLDSDIKHFLMEPNSSTTGQIGSFSETPASCDSSAIKSNCASSPDVKSFTKSSTSDISLQDTTFSLVAPSPVTVSTEETFPTAKLAIEEEARSSVTEKIVNSEETTVENLVNGEDIKTSSVVEEIKVEAEEDPQIHDMDISEHLNMKTVSSSPGIENSSSESGWEMQDSQSDVLSQSKSDETGNAGSKVPENSSGQFVYEFELPQELCGRLIGKHGKHVKSIKDRSHANVYIKRHPFDPQLKIVVVEGTRSDVSDALEIIRRKYPPSRYPTVTLVKTNTVSSTNVLPESLQLHIPEGASCDVILSSLMSAGHFFLQQPTHPTYPSLSTLDQCMGACYSQVDTPLLPHPVEAGVICAAPVLSGWYRAQVVYVYENEVDCELKFVDYGGFSQAPTSSLRQIRSDFMSLPFQASECYLANVRPVDPVEGWSAEATATFEELAQGQILQALVVEYASDGIPCVQLYRVQGISNMFINKELVERGLAVWVNNSHWDPH